MKFKNNSSLNKIIYCSLSWKPRWKWSRARKQLWDHVHFVAKDDFLSSRHHTCVIVAGKEELREIMCLLCLKHMTLGVLYHSCFYYISKNLIAWPHHTRRKAEKWGLYLSSHDSSSKFWYDVSITVKTDDFTDFTVRWLWLSFYHSVTIPSFPFLGTK